MLELSIDVQFANDGTGEDYARSKLNFITRNRFDRYQSYHQLNQIVDFRDRFFIQVTDNPPCCFGRSYFIFFGLLTFNALYSSYLDCCCHRQAFVIRKVVSTRTDLNSLQMQNQYNYYDPCMVMPNQMVVFAPTQAPQVLSVNQTAAQQYMKTPMVQPQTLFVPGFQGEEIMESPEGVTQMGPSDEQHTGTMLQANVSQSTYPQYGITQGQYPPPQHLVVNQQMQSVTTVSYTHLTLPTTPYV
eukprot:TRINITY_DN6477_c0_g1_i8.p2 TRINITY_DN6477_c0_g1~~TRINITY_DN6477_c0_g1_i8.p2  ORF type:complete len:243 (-),score=47.74 TRINITY_DN6477_c0_g1_i8:45-773(-)